MKHMFSEDRLWSKCHSSCAMHSHSFCGMAFSQSPCHAMKYFPQRHTEASFDMPQWPFCW